MTGIGFENPWLLVLTPLALLPLLRPGNLPVGLASLSVVPKDLASSLIEPVVRVSAGLALLALTLALSGPYREARAIPRVGQGAQMVLLLDRSRSMDQPFAGQPGVHALSGRGYESKGHAARRLLSEFAARRGADMFAMVVFSTHPIQVLPLTENQQAVQAAIGAGNVGRGLSRTDVGAGIERALDLFEGRAYAGSRIVLLVSDGAARLDLDTRLRIENLMRRHRAALYWIYIRAQNSPGLFTDAADEASGKDTPARALHRFFADMGSPYRVYTAENPQDLERAIADVGRLQQLPIHYSERLPRTDLSASCYLAALLPLTILSLARLAEVRTWT